VAAVVVVECWSWHWRTAFSCIGFWFVVDAVVFVNTSWCIVILAAFGATTIMLPQPHQHHSTALPTGLSSSRSKTSLIKTTSAASASLTLINVVNAVNAVASAC
jgi:hypothetical protein